MSFRTQRLTNAFPLWAKIRRDPSSFGARFLDSFAQMGGEMSITNMKIMQDIHLLKHYLGVGYLYSFYLDEGDEFYKNGTGPGTYKWVYPTVSGTIGTTDYSLTRYEDLVSMLNAAPDRISPAETQAYSSLVVWDSTSPYTVVSPTRPERLYIEISNSTFYSRVSSRQDREYSGQHTIQVAGTDENDIDIREYIDVLDDGVFVTRNIFKTVEEVLVEGFDGTVVIKWFADAYSYELDPYRAAVFDDFEGQLRLSLTTQVVDSTTYSYVVYSSPRLKLGEEYRRPEIEATSNVENLAEVVLLDSSGNPYTAVDLAINHHTSKLYVLDDQGSVHVYDHELSPFSVFSSSDIQTSTTHMELVPLRHRAKYGDTEYVYTGFTRLRHNVTSVQIKRQSPDGTVEYLQSDKTTWAAGQYAIPAPNPNAVFPEGSWSDIRFSTEYDQLGQWEYALTLTTPSDTTVYVTAVMVDSLTAESSIATGVSSPVGLGFSKEGYIAVADASEVHYFQEVVDGWIADTQTQRVLMRADYDQIEVSY